MKILTCHRRSLHALILLLFSLILTGPGSLAAESTQDKPGNLHVTSDKLIAEQGNAMVEFIGNVRATRDDTVLLADSVKIFLKPDAAEKDNTAKDDKGQGKVDKIIATGHVEYTAGERKAFADKAVYTTADEKLVLTGKNPKLLTGKSWVAGRKITLFRQEERVMVESDGKKRVQAFFDSEDQPKEEQKKDGAE